MVSFFKFHSSGSFSNSMPLLSLSVPGECHLAARGKNKLPRLAAQHANYGTTAVKLQIKKMPGSRQQCLGFVAGQFSL